MRRSASNIPGLALVLLLLLTACGGGGAEDAPAPEDEPPAQSALPEEDASDTFPETGGDSGYVPPAPEGASSKEAARPEDAELAEAFSPALPAVEDEKTDWQIVSTDAETFNLTGSFDNPNFEYVFNHTDTVPLDQLIAFTLVADAASEGADCELRDRFVEAPSTVLAYLVLMGDQITELSGWEPAPTAELVCRFIASADAAFYGGTEEFTQTMAACREMYPEGRITELLDVMEREHAASMERNS